MKKRFNLTNGRNGGDQALRRAGAGGGGGRGPGDGDARPGCRQAFGNGGRRADAQGAGERVGLPDQLSVYEELRLEELRIKRLKADALERDAAVAAGELIPAADVHARLGAGALAIRQGMEATRRAVLAAATKGCRKAVADNRNLLEGMKSAMGKGG